MEVKVNNAVLTLKRGDITHVDTDAIVNAANSGLRGGGGVDGAIHRAGGPLIMEECRKIGHCPTGQAVVTTAGAMKARWVIHTVGPVYRGGIQGEAELLKSAYRESLAKASMIGAKSIAFPAISAGVYGYPLEKAAAIALGTVIEYLEKHDDIAVAQFVLFDQHTFDVFKDVLNKLI